MGSITEWVHDSSHIVRDAVVQLHYVGFWDAEVFCESTVTVHTYTDTVFANVLQATTAVTAMTASNVTFTCYTVAYSDVADTRTYFSYDTYVFVTDSHWSLDGLLAPFVPLVDVQVGTANTLILIFAEVFTYPTKPPIPWAIMGVPSEAVPPPITVPDIPQLFTTAVHWLAVSSLPTIPPAKPVWVVETVPYT